MKTFTSYKKNQTSLDPVVSEKLLKIFSLYDKGLAVFGNISEFNLWLSTPSFGLGKSIPRDLLDTITGIELVSEELTRIEYGDLA
jgi:putative toxin-antitoxin system antitoxin component (TIGR02293 family)